MKQQKNLVYENHILKNKLQDFYNTFGKCPIIDDKVLKGSVRVVKTIEERDKIPACYRKQGMKVIVVGKDLSFKEYILKTDNCKENTWEEINVTVKENEVYLIEDYSELSENLTTQKELNLVLKQLILNLQTQIDNIELTDEKVQITEATNFAQIGQTQKDFNKNVSDYKTNSDLKNQEQDDRLTNIEGINYTWSPTNRTLTLHDNNGNQLSQVSLVSLDNEGTDLRYNSSTLSLELWNTDNQLLDSIPVSSFIGSVGTQLQLNSNQLQLKDSQGNVLSTVSFTISNIQGLQTALDAKEPTLIPGTSAQYYRGDKTWQVLDKAAVGLSGVDNTSDANKPVSTAQAAAITTKLDKTTTTVAAPDATFKYVYLTDESNNVRRMLAGDLGKNVANSSLTSVAGAGLALGSSWTLNTNGQLYSVTNLPDKSAEASFNSMIVQNSTGQVAKSNGWNVMKNAMQLASDAEKDAWRIASRKTDENYSLGQPRIDSILPPLINKNLGYVQYVTVIGLNLFVDNVTQGQAQIKLKNTTTNQEFLINQFTSYQYLPDRLTFGVDFATYPQGDYSVSVFHNGQWSLPNLNRLLKVRENLTPLPLPNLTWELADTTGIKPTLNKVSTYSDRLLFDTIPVSSKYFAQSVESLFNNQDLIDGAVAVFNVTFMGGDGQSHADMYWGFSSGSFSNNTQFDTHVQILGAYPHWIYTYFRPSNKSYVKHGGGRRTVLTDTVYVTVKNGVVDYFFVNNNMIATEVLSNFSTADFKMKIAGFSNAGDGGITPLIDIRLINKFSLAN